MVRGVPRHLAFRATHCHAVRRTGNRPWQAGEYNPHGRRWCGRRCCLSASVTLTKSLREKITLKPLRLGLGGYSRLSAAFSNCEHVARVFNSLVKRGLICMTGGNFRLLTRLLTQIERVLSVNDLHQVSVEVVEQHGTAW